MDVQDYAYENKSGEVAIMDQRSSTKTAEINQVKDKPKQRTSEFRPRPALLLDVAPQQPTTNQKEIKSESDESPEELLKQLLVNTEAAAQRTQSAKERWQLAAIISGMLFVCSVAVVGWLSFEIISVGTRQGRTTVENQLLREQANLADAQLKGMKGEVNTLLNRNLELVSENAQLKARIQTTSNAGIPVSSQPQIVIENNRVRNTSTPQIIPSKPAKSAETLDAHRMDAILRGVYPSGATKQELTAVMGKPDRIYRTRQYEQLVYFGREPGRFWFLGGRLVQAGG